MYIYVHTDTYSFRFLVVAQSFILPRDSIPQLHAQFFQIICGPLSVGVFIHVQYAWILEVTGGVRW